AELLGELLQRVGALALRVEPLLRLLERLGDIGSSVLLRRLGGLLERLQRARPILLLEAIGEPLHLIVEIDEIAITERALRRLEIGIGTELPDRALEPRPLLALAEREPLGGDAVLEPREIGERLALLDPGAELLAELLGVFGDLLEP